MSTLKKFARLFVTLLASVILSACALATSAHAQLPHTIHLPVVPNGPTLDPLNSYRITQTSVFTHPNSSGPEHIVQTYEWQRVENQYGFNSGSRFDLNGMTMQEMYLIDEDGYGAMFGLVTPRTRSQIDAEDPSSGVSVIPVLTVNGENDEGGFFGANGGLPVAISEIISQSQIVGSEIVNGVPTSHYQLDNTDLLTNKVVFGLNATISSAQGDFWIANDGEHVIRFVVRAEAENGATHHFEYLVDGINSLNSIQLPAKYQATIDALRDGTHLPHPDCETCLFPVFSNSTWGYDSMTVGNGLIVDSPINDMTQSQMEALYEQRLADLGWAVTKGEEWVVSNDTKDFSIRFEQLESVFRISVSSLSK